MIEIRNYPPHWGREQREMLSDLVEASFVLFLIDRALEAKGGGNAKEISLRTEYRDYVRDNILPRWRAAHGG